eukprot:gene34441-biopygen30022
MEHVPGRTLVVPDAASRRPDYVQTTARDGLKEAGYVDLSTDQAVTAEEGRRAAVTPDLWRDAMDTVTKMAAAISTFAGVATRAQRAAAAEQPATGDDPVSPLDAEVALQVRTFWTDCLNEQWRGRIVWCNPPFSDPSVSIDDILKHYASEAQQDPYHTAALFLLSDFPQASWRPLLREFGVDIVEIIPRTDEHGEPNRLFTSPGEERGHRSALHQELPVPWHVLVVIAKPQKPPSRKVTRERPTAQPAVTLSGGAARVRDKAGIVEPGVFLRALRAEHRRNDYGLSQDFGTGVVEHPAPPSHRALSA